MEEIRSAKYIKTNILKGRNINTIKFYNESGLIFESRQGWLERSTYPETVEGFDVSNVRNARKIDYTKKDNFCISVKDYLGESAYDLYIYTGVGGDIEILSDYETKKDMSEGETWFTRNLKIKNKYLFYYKEMKRVPEAVNNYGIIKLWIQ